MISQQVSSLRHNCLQWLTWKCTTNGSKNVEIRDLFFIQLFVHTFCMNLVYKLYTQCLWCTHSVDQNWCIQIVYKMFVYKMYPTFRQTFVHIVYTKFSWHSSFDFVYKRSAKVCWNLAYILYTSVVYILYSFSTQNVYTVFVWEIFKRRVFKNVTNFTGKDVLESNFSKVAGLTLLKTNSNRCFPAKFTEFLKSLFSQNTSSGYFQIYQVNPCFVI